MIKGYGKSAMPIARRGSRKRQQNFRQSVPLAIGGRVRSVSRPVSISSASVLVVFVVFLIGLMVWFALSPRFYVTGATVIGAGQIPAEAIFAASGLYHRHILWADGRAAERRILEALPSVEKARVLCLLPARCFIAVTVRAPVVAWESNGTYYWVDAAGGAFPATGPLEGRWLVHGPLPTDERGLVVRDVLVGLEELEQLGLQPGPILYRQGRGLVLDDPAGWRVVVGQGTGMERRLQVYLKIRAHFLERGIHPRFVDVRFPDAPYYSEVNDW